MTRRFTGIAFTLSLAGCATLEPPLPEARPDIPTTWPIAAPTTASADGQAPGQRAVSAGKVADIAWRDFFVDEALQPLIARALENNRDLRVAVLNVERARQLYRIQRAQRLPAVSAELEATRIRGGGAPDTESYSASVGLAGFELDLFGRVKSLSEAALRQYFATEEARRAAQLTLISEVANAWLTLAADRELLQVSRATLAAQEASFSLAQKRYELGAVSRLDFAQARTSVESARADTAHYEGQVARDTNALQLLVGAPVDGALLPGGISADQVSGLSVVPGGLPSHVLLRRPDVRQAEEQLRANNADIGAARAAFFPSITLTGSAGSASRDLSGLFGAGSLAWSFIPRVTLPIFEGGRLRAQLGATTAERDIALAQYEKAIQAGFREVSDALALARTLAEQRETRQAVVAAAEEAQKLSEARYKAGRDSYLVLLDAQRTLYAAQQALLTTRLQELSNRVVLYKALGGGWKERE